MEATRYRPSADFATASIFGEFPAKRLRWKLRHSWQTTVQWACR